MVRFFRSVCLSVQFLAYLFPTHACFQVLDLRVRKPISDVRCLESHQFQAGI
jgi:hypothetical protein